VPIPIGNVYYLLCYAWGHMDESDVVDLNQLGDVSTIHDLLGKVLAEGTNHLLRRGLDRGYEEVREDLTGIRGKIEVASIAKRALRARGRVACVFEELSHDVPHNQIIRSTLAALLRLHELDPRVRDDVRSTFRRMDGVQVVRLDSQRFRRVQLDPNRRVYRFLVSVCRLIHDQLIVDDRAGTTRFRDFREDDHRMWQLFEDFTREFYSREQKLYDVNRKGRSISWFGAAGVTERDESLIPAMEADVLLDAGHRRIILDTKYYAKALSERWGSKKLHSDHLYQILAYLRNREQTLPGARHDGIVLYPVVDESISADVALDGFRIQARGINLAQDWRSIHNDMIKVLD
jgi:5-methylcytosine-specific restriction enzyme subunit McrC